MIIKVILQNFRKHVYLEVSLEPGLNVVRAPNEGGKTTLLEGILYSWFGSSALTQKLDAVVTDDGTPKSKLSSTVEFTHQQKPYTCKRSPGGAEITSYGKVVCTGQTECTSFMEGLFGMPTKTAHSLLLAAQGDIRGILEKGDVHSFIEKLANFTEIDTIVELIQSKLQTGAVGPAKSALEIAETQLEAIETPIKPVKPDISKFKAGLEEYKKHIDIAQVNLDEVSLKRDAGLELNNLISINQVKLQTTKNSINAISDALCKLELDRPDPGRLAELKATEEGLRKQIVAYDCHKKFQQLPKYPKSFWEGDLEAFGAYVKTTEGNLRKAQHGYDTLQAKINNSLKLHDTTCPTCKQKLPNAEAVAKLNEKAESDKAALVTLADELSCTVLARDGELKELSEISNIQVAYARFVTDWHQHELFSVDVGCVPHKLIWKGSVPQPPDLVKLELTMNRLKDWQDSSVVAKYNAEQKIEHEKSLRNLQLELTKFEAYMTANKAVDITELNSNFETIKASIDSLKSSYAVLEKELTEVNNKYALDKVNYDNANKNKVQAQVRVTQAKLALQTLEENNFLLKSVREARIAVNDQIWNLELRGITRAYNELRGTTDSIITKSGKEFRCNGKPINSLSGSTRDVLGLANRFALARMFLPMMEVTALDEPASACDRERSNRMLGFIKNFGFDQTILVTHNEYDEAGADHLILLD